MQISDRQAGTARARRAIRVHGSVHGVGFRPTVYRMALDAHLGGFVRNDSEGVWIEIEGDGAAIARFTDALVRDAPPLARIGTIEVTELAPCGERDFHMFAGALGSRASAPVAPDVATCDPCLWELLDPSDRRYRYPFISCAQCGPRFTMVDCAPSERLPTTTLRTMAMCPRCRAEYEDPHSRRFRAAFNTCPTCGPRLSLVEGGVPTASGEGALAAAVDRLARGAIIALKGPGGYQLAVDAGQEDAVRRLRHRKGSHKPLAVMAGDLATIESIADVGSMSREALRSAARPIVLLPCESPPQLAAGVAPGLPDVGMMLPATPLHHLLLDGGPALLVVTSGNHSGMPIACEDEEAFAALANIADAFLVHDRRIPTRIDDSVVRVVGGAPQAVRRARGWVPEPVALGAEGPCVVAVGAQVDNTICVTRGSDAYLSQPIGGLEGPDALATFEENVAKLSRLLGAEPTVIVHDFHPDYASTRWAARASMRRMAVQHHHAHIASCMTEHGRHQAVIGVAFDESGSGPAGELWGGELLLADLAHFRRLGHLRPIVLPRADVTSRENWQLGIAALRDAGEGDDLYVRVDPPRRDVLRQALECNTDCPPTTSAGCWFRAVASIVGARDVVSYSGQATAELEALAWLDPESGRYPFVIEDARPDPFVLDLRPTVRAMATDMRRGDRPSRIAARFHTTLAQAVLEGCCRVRAAYDVRTVVLSGDCFQNRLLTEQAQALLDRGGFEVLVHRCVPPGDGGVALGQAAIAAYRLRRAAEGQAEA